MINLENIFQSRIASFPTQIKVRNYFARFICVIFLSSYFAFVIEFLSEACTSPLGYPIWSREWFHTFPFLLFFYFFKRLACTSLNTRVRCVTVRRSGTNLRMNYAVINESMYAHLRVSRASRTVPTLSPWSSVSAFNDIPRTRASRIPSAEG